MTKEASEELPSRPGPVEPASACWIKLTEIADRYDAIHQRGEQPELDEHLQQLPPRCAWHQTELLNLLLLTDAHYWPLRVQRDVSKQDLLETYPHHADAIQQTAIARELDDGRKLKWRLGKFQIEEKIFAGQQGKVFKAIDRHLGRTVALKIAHSQWPNDWLDHEGRVLASIQHPNILRVHELTYVNDEPILVMDYIESASLRHRYADTPLSEQQIIAIGVQLCDAVQCLHAHDLCHRDIKPENLLCSPQGVVTLIDFGLAMKFDRLSNPTEQCQAFDGTPAFMAPEQARKTRQTDPRRSDLYAIGATLLWLMVKQPPVQGDSVDEVLTKLRHGKMNEEAFTLASTRFPKTSKVVFQLLAVDPDERPVNAENALALLQELERTQASTPPLARRNQAILSVVVMLMGAAGCGILVFQALNRGHADQRQQNLSEKIEASDESPITTGSPKKEGFVGPLGIEFVRIPAGKFVMGSDDPAEYVDEDERPSHPVEITQEFYLSQNEITVGQFREFVEATQYETDAEKYLAKTANYANFLDHLLRSPVRSWDAPSFHQSDDHPVVNVSWNDASKFCEWLQSQGGRRYRLPTEAEWEYACRATTEHHVPHEGDLTEISNHSNVAGTSGNDEFALTAPVGSFAPNHRGLFDMQGNVAEWCLDWYGADYYAMSPLQNPTGPEAGDYRVYRGGGFSSQPVDCRSSDRNGLPPTGCDEFIGFRVVAEAKLAQSIVGTWTIQSGDSYMWSSPVTFHKDGKSSLAFGSWNYDWDGTDTLKIILATGRKPSSLGGNDDDYQWTVKFLDQNMIELSQHGKLDLVLKRKQ